VTSRQNNSHNARHSKGKAPIQSGQCVFTTYCFWLKGPSQVYFSLSSTFGSFLALNGQPATIEHRNNPNVDDGEK
jgi:hypothetical protein